MAESVEECAIKSGGALVVEAGTGTGKSLAYLMPALEACEKNGSRLLISTHTLNLQSQLFNKRPAAGAEGPGPGLGGHARAGKVQLPLPAAHPGGLQTARPQTFLAAAAAICSSGCRSGPRQRMCLLRERLPFEVPAQRLGSWPRWRPLAAWASPARKAGRCGFLRDRARLQSAQVVVANHALLLADAAARRDGQGMLPEAEVLVLDEAHHVESVASQQFLGLAAQQSRFGQGPGAAL